MKAGSIVPLLVLAAACQPTRQHVTVDKAWVRLSAVPANPSAAYFTLDGGPKDETLTNVVAPQAIRAEMHESMKSDSGMMSMAPLKLVAVRAGESMTFAPGGKHVMLFGLKSDVKPGGAMPLILTFASGRTVTVSAKLVGAGESAPGE